MTRRRTPPTDSQRRSAAATIVKTLGDELSVVAKPLALVDVLNIPNSVEPAVRSWLRSRAGHEVYGSAAMATHQITGRQPADLDIVVGNPNAAARSLASVMRRGGVKCRVVPSESAGAYIVQTFLRGAWQDAIDIHPNKGHAGAYEFYGRSKPPGTKNGIRLQRASDQLLRKANSVTTTRKDGSMGAAPARELKDTRDFVANARLLLASMETRTKAQTARARKVRAAITLWERYLRAMPGAPAKPRRKPVSKTRNTRFTQKARANPEIQLEDLIFEGGAAVVQRELDVVPPGAMTGSPYAEPVYSPYAGTGHAHNPYEQAFTEEIEQRDRRRKTTKRRKPYRTKNTR